jgi:uncharacterized protein YlzI (FlbEa/FlbD family)
MANRVGGIAYLTVNGRMLALRGSFTVTPSRTKKTGVAGQDGVHGFTEMPQVPSIKGNVTLTPDTSVEELDAIDDGTVMAELANGKNYVLREAWSCGGESIDTAEGQTPVNFEGMSCDEY